MSALPTIKADVEEGLCERACVMCACVSGDTPTRACACAHHAVDLSENPGLTSLDGIGKLAAMTKLDANSCGLTKLPDEIEGCAKLKELLLFKVGAPRHGMRPRASTAETNIRPPPCLRHRRRISSRSSLRA